MNGNKTKWDKFMDYMRSEIGIEYKACLYFYCILFFYCCYLLLKQIYAANILHMAEMILTTYLMGYLQVYLFGDFDDTEHFGKRELAGLFICTFLYAGVSYLFGWFDRKLLPTVIFFFYILFACYCASLINRIKRNVDTKYLNNMLHEYKQQKEEENGESH